ncbi:MAG: hypothetical protein AABY65_06640 [Nitrospirota bacterium]
MKRPLLWTLALLAILAFGNPAVFAQQSEEKEPKTDQPAGEVEQPAQPSGEAEQPQPPQAPQPTEGEK